MESGTRADTARRGELEQRSKAESLEFELSMSQGRSEELGVRVEQAVRR